MSDLHKHHPHVPIAKSVFPAASSEGVPEERALPRIFECLTWLRAADAGGALGHRCYGIVCAHDLFFGHQRCVSMRISASGSCHSKTSSWGQGESHDGDDKWKRTPAEGSHEKWASQGNSLEAPMQEQLQRPLQQLQQPPLQQAIKISDVEDEAEAI